MLSLERTTCECAGCGGEAPALSDFCGGCRERGLAFCDLCSGVDILTALAVDGRPANVCQDCLQQHTCENCGSTDRVEMAEDQQEGGRVLELRCAACRGEREAA